ncbi:hypothetical protein [Bifidobacterium aquikefiri]|uniref:hypothetical protein n=1 Tax=Bifidobacterium aquikefiri TaxID=1653207 RepID=UPI0039EA99BD
MSVVKSRSSKTAYALVVSYTTQDEDFQAARVYAESRISLKQYMKAVGEGRKKKNKNREQGK